MVTLIVTYPNTISGYKLSFYNVRLSFMFVNLTYKVCFITNVHKFIVKEFKHPNKQREKEGRREIKKHVL